MSVPGDTWQSGTKRNRNADHSEMYNIGVDYTSDPIIAHAQSLVKALNDFIVSIIPVQTVATRTNKVHNQAVSAPEAKEFIFALRKLILDTIGSSSDAVITDEGISGAKDNATLFDKRVVPVKVTRTPTLSEIFGDIDEGDHDKPTNYIETSPSEKAQGKMRACNGRAIPTVTMEPLQAQLNIPGYLKVLDISLDALRQHIFNKMPIRLLCFQSYGSDFRISLLEKGGIFTHLAAKVRAQFSEPQFMANIRTVPSIKIRLGGQWCSVEQWISVFAKYAILSHTWIHTAPGEVTYDHWNKKQYARGEPGYEKLLNFCKVAERDYGVTLGWVDTVCINKESSAELDESIRSMFKWYRDASICLTYLAQTHVLSDMSWDPWFTRGWTLQELLAPSRFKFYTAHWDVLVPGDNDKANPRIHMQITAATSITPEELLSFIPEDVTAGGVVYKKEGYSGISRRMEWAARRQVTRQEDAAYSLMGLFNVSMSIAYGEGAERAFLRLLKKILAASTYNSDMFNWAPVDRRSTSASTFRNPSSLLPTKLQDYLQRAKVEPTLFSHLGLRLQVLLAPAILAPNPNREYRAIGDYSCQAKIACVDEDASALYDGMYNLLHEDLFFHYREEHGHQTSLTFGILNFLEGDSSVSFHQWSIAVALYCKEDPGMVSAQGRPKRIHTKEPVVCAFENKEDHDLKGDILKSDLAMHGLQLVTLYL